MQVEVMCPWLLSLPARRSGQGGPSARTACRPEGGVLTDRDFAAEAADIDAVVGNNTLAKAFLRTAAANADVVALRRMSGAGQWEETTYGQLRDQVARVTAGLRAAGLGEGQRMVP
jgi:long-subunit acyl-CoA synthetase (AMP-forming)